MAGLVVYLAGPGRANEHTAPQLITGDDRVVFAVEPGRTLTNNDALNIANVLDEPRRIHGTAVQAAVKEYDEASGEYVTTGKKDAHVWHASLSLKADEGELTREKWAEVAHDFVEKMGFIDPDGAKTSRWAAIHHGASKNGNDHIHIAVQLVREDGTKADVRHDFKRAHRASNEIEKKYGLMVLASREHEYGISGDKPAEVIRAERQGAQVTERAELRRRARTCLATASSQDEYIRHLHDLGVHVQPRFAKNDRNTIVGYRLAFPSASKEQGGDGRQIWYSPSKLDRSLAWPRIEERYGDAGRVEAVAMMHQIREKTVSQPDKATKVHQFSAESYEKLISGKVGPDTMANIYARISMGVEKNSHGPLVRLSDDFSRVAWSMRGHQLAADVLYQQGGTRRTGMQHSAPQHSLQSNSSGVGRLGQQWLMATQAGRRGPVKDWVSLLAQANRIARIVTETNLIRERTQLARTMHSTLDVAEVLTKEHVAQVTPMPNGKERAAQLREIGSSGQQQARYELERARADEAEKTRKVPAARRALRAAEVDANEAVSRHERLLSAAKNKLETQVGEDATRGREADTKVLSAGMLTRGKAVQASDSLRRELTSRWGIEIPERVKPPKQKPQSTNPFTGVQAQMNGLWSTWAQSVIGRQSSERLNTAGITQAHAARVAAEQRRGEAAARLTSAEQEEDQAQLHVVMLAGRVNRSSLRDYLTRDQKEELAKLEGHPSVRPSRTPEEGQTRGVVLGSTRARDSGYER